jgi:hypothetical protein
LRPAPSLQHQPPNSPDPWPFVFHTEKPKPHNVEAKSMMITPLHRFQFEVFPLPTFLRRTGCILAAPLFTLYIPASYGKATLTSLKFWIWEWPQILITTVLENDIWSMVCKKSSPYPFLVNIWQHSSSLSVIFTILLLRERYIRGKLRMISKAPFRIHYHDCRKVRLRRPGRKLVFFTRDEGAVWGRMERTPW